MGKAALPLSGSLDGGIDLMRLGMQISPRDRRLAFWGWAMAVHMLHAERPEEALAEAHAARERDPIWRASSRRARWLGGGAYPKRRRRCDAPASSGRLWRSTKSAGAHGQRVCVELASIWATAEE